MNNTKMEDLHVNVNLTFADLKLLEAAKKFGVLNEETAKEMREEHKKSIISGLERLQQSLEQGYIRIDYNPASRNWGSEVAISIIEEVKKL